MLDTNIFLYEITRTILFYSFPDTSNTGNSCFTKLLNSDLIYNTERTVHSLKDGESVNELITITQDIVEGKYEKDEFLNNIAKINKKLKGDACVIYNYFTNLFNNIDSIKERGVLEWT